MRRLLVLGCCCALLITTMTATWAADVSPNPADLAVPSEVNARAQRLVEQLGSEIFAEREAAERELTRLGRFARPALLHGASHSPDPEVRHRCTLLLPQAQALELQARLDTFLADTNGDYEHDLPGWKPFLALVRNDWTLFGHTLRGDRSLDRAAKAVFTELIAHSDNRRLIFAAAQRDFDFRNRVLERRVELYNRKYGRIPGVERRDPTLSEITVLLFAEALVPNVYPARNTSISSLLTSSGLIAAANRDTDEGRVYRAIATAWLVSRRDPRDMYYAMTIASSLNQPDELCTIAVKLLTSPGISATYRGRAASNLISYGSEKHLPLLDKTLTDTTVVATLRLHTLTADGQTTLQTYEIQARDMALAVAIQLTGQKLSDYGYTDRYGSNSESDRTYAYTRFYFSSPERREAAFQKWQAQRTTNQPHQ
ncbi:MAG: hypothetical protein RMJ56_09865 [Gemmataceae bacterium]|nr:hypothetical protein [Gemmata sp.]MDW8197896.1 hypothetical protein [Gemmataceae bacterium]